jgi:hypothetical protein
MKAIDAAEFVGKLFKSMVEDAKLTGSADLHLDSSQGHIRKVTVLINDVHSSKFEISDSTTDIGLVPNKIPM